MEKLTERTATGLGDGDNPWSKQFWHLANQARIILRDQDEADRMARAAGHSDWMSARLLPAPP
jgi:hypothetical protein